MPNQTNSKSRHSEFKEQTCLNRYLSKSSFDGICDSGSDVGASNGFIVEQPTLQQSSKSTLLSQATGRDLVAELLADKRSPLVTLSSSWQPYLNPLIFA